MKNDLCFEPSPSFPGVRVYTCELAARHRGAHVSRVGGLCARWVGRRGPITIGRVRGGK